ncbi:MAG: DUF4340 domain-containing protein [Phycisphaerales bacterium JB063]
MNLRTTLVLLIVLAAVAGAWWLTRALPDNPAPTTNTQNEPTPLFPPGTLKPQQVTRLEITQPGKPTVALEQHRGRWRMTQPLAFNADNKTINQLLSTLAAYADLGPAPAAAPDGSDAIAQLTLTQNNNTQTLRLGPRVGGGMAPLQHNDHPPRLVADTLHGFFERYDPTDLLDKQLQTPTAYQTSRLTITTPQHTTHLQQINDRWYLNADTTQPALDTPVPGYVDVPGYLNIPNANPIDRFVISQSQDLAPYGLNRPSVRIDYESPNPDDTTTASTLLVGSPTDARRTHYFATYFQQGETRSPVFVLPAEFSIVLAKTPDDFRDPRLFTLAPTDLQTLTLETPGQPAWSLDLTDEQGSLLAPARSIAGDAAQRRETIAALCQATAQGYLNPSDIPADPHPPITLTLTPTLDRPAQRVTLYTWDSAPALLDDAREQHLIAIREGETQGLRIPQSLLDQLQQLAP